MFQELRKRCQRAYQAEAANKKAKLEEELRSQIGSGDLSIIAGAEELENALRDAENDAFQAFYASGGEERVAIDVWQDPDLSEQRAHLIQEADTLEKQADKALK